MKQWILLSVIVFTCNLALKAQEKPEKILFKWDQKTMETLAFTPEQVEKFKQIQKETNIESAAIRKDENLTEEQKKEKMKELVSSRSAKQHAVLTPEQLKRTVELKKKIRETNAANGYD